MSAAVSPPELYTAVLVVVALSVAMSAVLVRVVGRAPAQVSATVARAT